MKKILITIFTVAVIGVTVCAAFAAENMHFANRPKLPYSVTEENTATQKAEATDTGEKITSEVHHSESSISHYSENHHTNSFANQSEVFASDENNKNSEAVMTERVTEQIYAVNTNKITLEKAKEIAVSYVGGNTAEAVFTEKDCNFDDGSYVYELEFCASGYEYDCEIDALNGTIIKCEKAECSKHEHKTDIENTEGKKHHREHNSHSSKHH